MMYGLIPYSIASTGATVKDRPFIRQQIRMKLRGLSVWGLYLVQAKVDVCHGRVSGLVRRFWSDTPKEVAREVVDHRTRRLSFPQTRGTLVAGQIPNGPLQALMQGSP